MLFAVRFERRRKGQLQGLLYTPGKLGMQPLCPHLQCSMQALTAGIGCRCATMCRICFSREIATAFRIHACRHGCMVATTMCIAWTMQQCVNITVVAADNRRAMTMSVMLYNTLYSHCIMGYSLHAAVEARESVCSFCISAVRVSTPVGSHALR